MARATPPVAPMVSGALSVELSGRSHPPASQCIYSSGFQCSLRSPSPHTPGAGLAHRCGGPGLTAVPQAVSTSSFPAEDSRGLRSSVFVPDDLVQGPTRSRSPVSALGRELSCLAE